MHFSRRVVSITVFCAAMTLTNVANAGNAQCNGECGVCTCGGPGTEMTQIINRIGLGSDCGRCKALAAQMDNCGPNWVCNNFDHVVARTISNAENLGNRMGPVRRVGVRAVVRTAVRRSR